MPQRTGFDPITHHSMSPYMAFDGNPVYWRDPSGADSMTITIDGINHVIDSKDYKELYNSETDSADEAGEILEHISTILGVPGPSASGSSPNFKFPKGLYPRFNQILSQLYNYVKNNPFVLEALMTNSKASEEEIFEQLRDGQGAIISALYMSNYGESPRSGSGIQINLAFINGLEIAKLDETIQGTSFLLAVTVLHEVVHYLRTMKGLDRAYEYGDGFERDAFGGQVHQYNSNNLYSTYGWNLKY